MGQRPPSAISRGVRNMNRISSVCAIVGVSGLLLGHASGMDMAPSGELTSVQAIHALSNVQANLTIPVRFEASVTYYKKGDVDLFVQDGDTAVYVEATPNLGLATGDRVLVTGVTRASFRPEVKAENVTFLRHGSPPDPVNASFQQLIRAELDCRRVTVRAVVRSANIVMDGGLQNIYLQLQMDGGQVDAEVINNDSPDAAGLIDSEVEIVGAVAGKFDNKMQMTGILIEIPQLSDVKVLKHAARIPASLPVTPMDQILGSYSVIDRSERVRVQGSITYYQPGSAVVLEGGDKSLLVTTQFEKPLAIGDFVSATGFPEVRNGSVTLSDGEIESSSVQAPVPPRPVVAAELASGSRSFDLVTVQGRLLMAVREAAQDEYVLVSQGHLFSAILRHPQHSIAAELPPMKKPTLGSMVRTTGICMLESGDRSLSPVAFEVLLRSPGDVAVIAGPPLLSVRNLVILVVFLVLVILAVAGRQWRIDRRMRRQTAELAQIEQRRSHILEEVNSARPVTEIIAKITELMSFKLGAQCWCELGDGDMIGMRPADFANLRVADCPVTSHSGSRLGCLSAASPRAKKPPKDEDRTLAMGAELVTLAVETRRLYTDLKRRSEFDLLTDTHNRFSLEKRLQQLIDDAMANGSRFGLIYIDLDGFKQINDLYGHKVGDLFLQKVALRMKHQLRTGDMLARIGGDEFAVLIPNVAAKEEAEVIAARLERCFGQPFSVDGNQLPGSASLGIAVYPEDGSTKDGILNSADAAMYASKYAKRHAQAADSRKLDSSTVPARN